MIVKEFSDSTSEVTGLLCKTRVDTSWTPKHTCIRTLLTKRGSFNYLGAAMESQRVINVVGSYMTAKFFVTLEATRSLYFAKLFAKDRCLFLAVIATCGCLDARLLLRRLRVERFLLAQNANAMMSFRVSVLLCSTVVAIICEKEDLINETQEYRVFLRTSWRRKEDDSFAKSKLKM